MTRFLIMSTLVLTLAGCGGEPGNKTATKLDAVEVQPGTISDSMILLDDARSDGTAIDNSDPEASAKAGTSAATAEDSEDTGAENEGNADSETDGETISGSLARKTATEPAKK